MKKLSQLLSEKKLTPAELKKREEIAKAMEKDNPGMDMGKKMAIATAAAKKVAEEAEQIDERNKENALRRKMMDASRGSRYKSSKSGPVPEPSPEHKTPQAHNKAIGRALRSEEACCEDKDPCWDSHEMIGMKTKNGKKVPNCVPKNEEIVEENAKQGMKPVHLNPGWMLKADPKLAAKVKANKDLHKKRVASYGNPAAGKSVNKEKAIEEGLYKAELEGLPPTFVSGDSVSDVRSRLRSLVKNPGEQIKDVQKVQPAQMKKYFRDMSTSKEVKEATDQEELSPQMDLTYLREALADAFTMYFMAHQFHWNVTGPDFIQYHNFLGELYEEVHSEVDDIAEKIRIAGSPAPLSLLSIVELTNIDEQTAVVTSPQQMMAALEDANDDVILSLYGALDVATDANDQGLMNFLADRIDAHAKISWKLSSSQE